VLVLPLEQILSSVVVDTDQGEQIQELVELQKRILDQVVVEL
jgi:hypothetical protein